MSVYRVKLGNEIVDVEGVEGLLDLVKQGRLGPEDPVFIPASGKWHYARSVRQLREHFAIAPPEPPPPKEEEPDEAPSAQVLKLRRGRWTPDGKGVEVPVFAYEIDAEPPQPVRLALIALVGILAVALASTWFFGYRHYLDSAPIPTGTPPPPTTHIASATLAPAPATPAPRAPVATAIAASTSVPLPEFDADAIRRKVSSAKLTPVSRPDALGAALRTDLTRLAIPVHEATLVAVKGARDSAVPFALRVDYAPPEKTSAVALAKARFAIVAMVGRRIGELHLHVQSFHLRTLAGKKIASDVEIPVDLAQRVASGSASRNDVSALFAGK